MHAIEPFYGWRDDYIASEDKLSPFYRRQYNEFEYTSKIYNYYIHPQWDSFGSSTLYCKILFADYEAGYCIVELLGEWNDTLHNDMMELKNTVINPLVNQGITKFILLGENVLNFHASDELYFEEWYDDIKDEGGWIAAINFREHVAEEMQVAKIHHYLHIAPSENDLPWRKFKPADLFLLIEAGLQKYLNV